MKIEPIFSNNREQVNNFIRTQWFSTSLAIRGELIDATLLDGIVVYENESIIGLVTYRLMQKECEITSLDSLCGNQGIGTMLINQII